MAFINPRTKTIQAKIVYYGPARGGKTTNLETIFKLYRDRIPSEMVSIKTTGDRTLFFDFFPFDVGKVKGYEVKIQLYTVPGQVKYNATRQLVLKGVDGIVFVADSMAVQRKNNLTSLKNLQENLKAHNKNIFKIPLVLQFNKMDLKDKGIPVLSPEILQQDLNKQLKVPFFEASALSGVNVAATLKKIIAETVASFQEVI